MSFGCWAAPQHLENCTHHEPPAQPSLSTICRLLIASCTLQRLYLTLQWPMACPGLVTHTLAGLCALCLLGGTSASETLQHSAKLTHHKPPAQPVLSTQFRLHHTCCKLLRLHLTLKWPIACPGLAIHTLAGLCALWLPGIASASERLQRSVRMHPPQTNRPAQPQHPVQAQPHLLHT